MELAAVADVPITKGDKLVVWPVGGGLRARPWGNQQLAFLAHLVATEDAEMGAEVHFYEACRS